jgi:hypothetical protein
MEVTGQLHAQATLPPRNEPLVPIGLGGWVGPRAGLNTVVKRNFQPLSGLEPSIIKSITQRCTNELSQLIDIII